MSAGRYLERSLCDRKARAMTIRFPMMCAIFVGTLATALAQEVRRAVPATPTPNPFNAPRALPVNPANPQPTLSQQSILNQRIPTQSSADGKRDSVSSGSAAEPDENTKSRVANDEIRLAPGGNSEGENAIDPAKAQLAIYVNCTTWRYPSTKSIWASFLATLHGPPPCIAWPIAIQDWGKTLRQ